MQLITKICLVLGMLLPSLAVGQNKYTLSGYVRDGETGEDLASVAVFAPDLQAGTLTNEYGFYSLTLPEGQHTVIFRYLSFVNDTLQVNLNKDQTYTVELMPEGATGPVVELIGQLEDENVSSLDMSVQTMDLKQVKRLPSFMGEVDVIRSIQLLPGVSGVGEGITGYYVRGGQSNQNLILLDNATVYNASHLLGFFSVFNADALRDEYKLYKGGIPAQYGTRLSSVLDLHMKEGNARQFSASGGLGLIASRLTLEGPIAQDKASFVLSGRRTYGDLFLLASPNQDLRDTRLYFYDFNAKANWRISEKDRIFLSGYFGRDVFKFRDLFGNDWGNATATLRWNHLFSEKLFANTTLIFSDFDYGFDARTFTGEKFSFSSGIRDYGLKSDMTWFASPKHQLKFGLDVVLHTFSPGLFEPEEGTFLQPLPTQDDYALESAVYLSNEHKVSPRFSMVYGLRYSMFDHLGPGEEYVYNEDFTEQLDTTEFSTGQVIQHYGGLEPRLGARFLVNENSSVKASYMRTRQYLHLASNSTASFPWDIWIPSSRHIEPQIADQVAVGYFRNFADNRLESSIELYYKDMRNQIDFKNGAELLLNPTIETEVLIGKGWSYGAEFFLKKKTGKLTGWIGYTWSKTQRQIDGINEGKPYAANNDRRHDVSVVGTYALTDRLTLGGTWVYATGNAVTYPVGGYYLDSNFVVVYGDRNASRMPAYHRMDVSLTLDGKTRELQEGKRKLESSWNLSVYNAYGRRNAFAIDFREETNNGVTERKAVKIYLFRWVPSITWNFRF